MTPPPSCHFAASDCKLHISTRPPTNPQYSRVGLFTLIPQGSAWFAGVSDDFWFHSRNEELVIGLADANLFASIWWHVASTKSLLYTLCKYNFTGLQFRLSAIQQLKMRLVFPPQSLILTCSNISWQLGGNREHTVNRTLT